MGCFESSYQIRTLWSAESLLLEETVQYQKRRKSQSDSGVCQSNQEQHQIANFSAHREHHWIRTERSVPGPAPPQVLSFKQSQQWNTKELGLFISKRPYKIGSPGFREVGPNVGYYLSGYMGIHKSQLKHITYFISKSMVTCFRATQGQIVKQQTRL
ncbi:hypothetical protein CIHG_03364 [Coccidioides immitis H538.4]|uniref:Uncharacterized protein n=1 Tax=Coccidioides immitis H538.4 TaxID=396776 RepID=A0A0J8RMK8_COCIT|nr:hypothetical protein CIHG_03364 [Coccidioides immitis H538.4]